MTEPIISINDLSVYFNKKKALNNVTMDFYPNEMQLSVLQDPGNQPAPSIGEWKFIPNGHLLVLFHTTVTITVSNEC